MNRTSLSSLADNGSSNFSQEVLINILVYYGIIKDVFNSDIDKEGDYKLLASRLQNFLICVEMFLAGETNC